MIKENFLKILFLIYIFLIQNVYSIENEIYKKIDLFGEVLEKINKEYVDEIISKTEKKIKRKISLINEIDPFEDKLLIYESR